MSVEHVSLWSVADVAYTRAPQRFAVGGVKSGKVASTVAAEYHAACRRQQTTATIAAGIQLVPPACLARGVVDAIQVACRGADGRFIAAAKYNGAARVGMEQLSFFEAVVIVMVQQTGLRRVSRRLPVHRTA